MSEPSAVISLAFVRPPAGAEGFVWAGTGFKAGAGFVASHAWVLALVLNSGSL